MVYNKAEFKKHINTLDIEGFQLKSGVQAYLFIRRQPNRTETVTISYRDYAPHGFYISGVSVDIYFNEVEDNINPLLDKYGIVQRFGNTTIIRLLQHLEGIDYNALGTEISNEETFNIVSKELQKLITKGAFSFFEKYKDIKTVGEEIAVMSEEGISNFLSGIVGIKVPLIKKLTKAADYKQELSNRKRFYSDEVFRYPQYFKDHEKVFNDLFSDDLKTL